MEDGLSGGAVPPKPPKYTKHRRTLSLMGGPWPRVSMQNSMCMAGMGKYAKRIVMVETRSHLETNDKPL